jgi:hypothetical protein
MIPPIYTLSEAAETLGISDDYLRSKLRDRTYPGLKRAGRWAMTEADILEAIRLMSHQAREDVPSPAGLVKGSRFRRRATERAS